VIESGPMDMTNTGAEAGIAGHIASLGHEPHQFTHFYIETDDVAASLKKVEAEGGKMVVPPVKIPSGTVPPGHLRSGPKIYRQLTPKTSR